ncbi:MAG: hypothetical protein E7218_02345 [Anaerofustis stercorihominis]|nr:hypothetical protein [Anaerofustis stercorihominis]
MKKIYSGICLILILLMLSTNVFAAGVDIESVIDDACNGLSSMAGTGGSLLAKGDEFPAGTSACDWTAISFALCGMKENYKSYLDDLKEYVEKNYERNGCLDEIKSTTYHRIALTATALGADATDFGTKPDGTPVDLIAEGTYNFSGRGLGAQGLNGYIYALICLDAYDTVIPQGALYTREDIISAIVNAQSENGGFGLAAGGSDVDITAMALQALAPYKNEYAGVIDKALGFLASRMTDECMFEAFSEASCESSAQVIWALSALGIDPEEDTRFKRGSNNILSAMTRYIQADGTFSHLLEDNAGDYLATSQALLALISLQKMRNGEGWIFDFTDYEAPASASAATVPLMLVAVVCIAAVTLIIKGKRKKNG